MARCRLAVFHVLCLVLLAVPAAAADYVHPTITTPIPDGISLELPKAYADSPLARMGYLDVTAPPFSADPTGQKDATAALQKAIDTARDLQMVCYLPTGTYLVSDTLRCIQGLYKRTSGRVYAARRHPVVMQGARGGKRPLILLSASSPGFDDIKKPKPVVHFWARSTRDHETAQPNISFNQVFANIDITVDRGNPGAIGIHHQAAQGSAIEECTIHVEHGYAGISGGIGSGGSVTDVSVIGGRLGLDLRRTQPVPTLTGIRLRGQSQAAILYYGRQSLVAVGLEIDYPGSLAAIQGPKNIRRPFDGQINLVDSRIDLTGSKAVGLASDASVYLRNCYVRGGSKALQGPLWTDIPSGREWTRIVECSAGQSLLQFNRFNYSAPHYLNAKRSILPFTQVEKGQPPQDLASRHLWTETLPAPHAPGAAIVTEPPYNARGDGRTDDTAALQRALNEHDTVLLPKGYFLVSRPLRLKPGNRLVGVAQHLCVITTTPALWRHTAPTPLLQTPDTPDADITLASLTLFSPKAIPNLYALHWQSGGQSVLRGVHARVLPPLGGYKTGSDLEWNHPLVVADGHTGGKWYRVNEDSVSKQGPAYRHFLFRGAKNLAIYQLNPEHAVSDAQVEFDGCEGVQVYGTKAEGNVPVLLIKNSKNFSAYGYGGKSAGTLRNALFVIDNSDEVRLTTLIETPALSGTDLAGTGLAPTRWSMVEVVDHGASWRTRPGDRPVLVHIKRPAGGKERLK